MPAQDLLAGQHRGGALLGIDRGEHGPWQPFGLEEPRPPAAGRAVLVQLHHPPVAARLLLGGLGFRVGRLGGDVGTGPSPPDNGRPPLLGVGEGEMILRLARGDADQGLLDQIDPGSGGCCVRWAMAEHHPIGQKGRLGLGGLAQVIAPLAWDQHLRLDLYGERDALGGLSEEMAHIGHGAPVVPDLHGRVHDRRIHQRFEEEDGIEKVRLAHRVDARDAGEGAEVDIDPDQVLESVDA